MKKQKLTITFWLDVLIEYHKLYKHYMTHAFSLNNTEEKREQSWDIATTYWDKMEWVKERMIKNYTRK